MHDTGGSRRSRRALGTWLGIMCIAFMTAALAPDFLTLPSGIATSTILGFIAGVAAGSELFGLITDWLFARRKKPASESAMVSQLYRLAALLAVVMIVAYGLGALASFTSFFTLFGGMLLGWSLQAPVSGFAAYLLVLFKRPFRPGDRVQFPNLGLTGDVHEIGPMYTVLNQVGGSIGSEEAVGRYILVPNAMLFSQVLINYTVTQEAAYILDEVTIRITYDSDWGLAERLLLAAANDVTPDIIAATGVAPYIRSDLYDYGVYLRLRYMTRVKDRPAIAYEITKRIFDSFQHETSVDFAIPYVYSYRAGAGKKDDEQLQDGESRQVRQIEVKLIEPTYQPRVDEHDISILMDSIAERGLLQPIVVIMNPRNGLYDIVAGHMRFEAVKRLGWETIPAIVRGDSTQTA